jgi:hypothetical protein
MAKYLLLALNGPTPGEGNEEALNSWYEDVHMPGFKQIPEVKSARRYKIMRGKIPGRPDLWPYVTAYEIETDDLPAVSARFQKELTHFHPTLDRESSGNIMAIQISGDD